jgi:hypothetical protein
MALCVRAKAHFPAIKSIGSSIDGEQGVWSESSALTEGFILVLRIPTVVVLTDTLGLATAALT